MTDFLGCGLQGPRGSHVNVDTYAGLLQQPPFVHTGFMEACQESAKGPDIWQLKTGSRGLCLPRQPSLDRFSAPLPADVSFRPDCGGGEMLLSEMENAWGRDDFWADAPFEGEAATQKPVNREDSELRQEDPFANVAIQDEGEHEDRPSTQPAADACSSWGGEPSLRRVDASACSAGLSRHDCDVDSELSMYSDEIQEPRIPAAARRTRSCARERMVGESGSGGMSTPGGVERSTRSAEHQRNMLQGSPCKRTLVTDTKFRSTTRTGAPAAEIVARGSAGVDGREWIAATTCNAAAGEAVIAEVYTSPPKKCRVDFPKPQGVLITSPLTLHKVLAAQQNAADTGRVPFGSGWANQVNAAQGTGLQKSSQAQFLLPCIFRAGNTGKPTF